MKALRISPPAWVAIVTVAIVALVFAMLYPALLEAAVPQQRPASDLLKEAAPQPMPTRFAPRRNAACTSASSLKACRKSPTS